MLSIDKHGPITSACAQSKFLGVPFAVYLYFIDGLLIDTGSQNMGRDTIPFFKEYMPRQTVITHCHEDHTGMAYWLDKKMGIPVYISPQSVKLTTKPPYIPIYRQWIWGSQLPFNSLPLGQTVETDSHVFDVIPSPGHSPDHVVLHEKNQGWLFGGDIFLAVQQKLLRTQESVPVQIESLKNILNLDFDTIFCGHGGVFSQGKRLLMQKLNYLEEVQVKVLDLSNKGLNPRQISHQLFPQKHPLTDLSQGEWSSYNMVRSICEPQTV